MAQGTKQATSKMLSKKLVKQLSAELGCSAEAVQAMPEMRLAWVLNKREVPNRPQSRLEYELDALCDDRGKVPDDAVNRALAQLDKMRAATHTALREVAGVPSGRGFRRAACRNSSRARSPGHRARNGALRARAARAPCNCG